eukprot:41405_1
MENSSTHDAEHADHEEFEVYRQFEEFQLIIYSLLRASKVSINQTLLFPIEITGILHTYYFLEQMNPFKSQKVFKLSNDNQTISPSSIKYYKRNSYRQSDIERPYAIGQTKFIPDATSTVHYWEMILDEKVSSTLFVGISSSNIDTFCSVPYNNVPCVCVIDISCYGGDIYDFKGKKARMSTKFVKDDRIGFLLDFKNKEYIGCVRLFKNSKEIQETKTKPFITNLNERKIIWEEVPPFSLFIAGPKDQSQWSRPFFKCTIVQNPQLPHRYKHLLAKKWQDMNNKKQKKEVLNGSFL